MGALARKTPIILDNANFMRDRAANLKDRSRASGSATVDNKIQHEKEQNARQREKKSRNKSIGITAAAALTGGIAGGIGLAGLGATTGTAGLSTVGGSLLGASLGTSFASTVLGQNPNALSSVVRALPKEILSKLEVSPLADTARELDRSIASSLSQGGGAYGPQIPNQQFGNDPGRVASEPIPIIDRTQLPGPIIPE